MPSHPGSSALCHAQHHPGIPPLPYSSMVESLQGRSVVGDFRRGGNRALCGVGEWGRWSHLSAFWVDLGVERKSGPASLLTPVIFLQSLNRTWGSATNGLVLPREPPANVKAQSP